MTDRERLRELARIATLGPWIRPWGANYLQGPGGDFDPAARQEDLDYIAAVDPFTVSTLLADLEAAEERLAKAESVQRCIFKPCVATWRHWHGGFPGGYDNPADPEGPPIEFTSSDPDPSAVRDYNGAALAAIVPEDAVVVTCLDYASHRWNRNGSPSFCKDCGIEFPVLRARAERTAALRAAQEETP